MIIARHLRTFIFILATLFCVQSVLPEAQLVKRTASITVFVHGSIFAFLSLLNIRDVTSDLLHDNLLYTSLINQIRANRVLEHDQLLFKLGPHQIENEFINQFWSESLEEENLKQAGHFIVPAYDSINRLFHDDTIDFKYYTYGHLGLLSQKYRASMGEEFYHWLVDLQAQYKQNYDIVRINVVGHSHGGGIVLHVARCEEQYDKGLSIDNVVFYGAPIQVETAEFAYLPCFKRVLNCYSDMDFMQVADLFSTSAWRSYQRFADKRLDIERPEKHTVYDIRLLVNNNRFRINHANMWLMGRSTIACSHLDPLPLMTLTPVLLDLLDQCPDHTHLDYNLLDTRYGCVATLKTHKDNQVLALSENLAPVAHSLQKIAKENWNPDDKSRNAVGNKKSYRVLKAAIKKLIALSKAAKAKKKSA